MVPANHGSGSGGVELGELFLTGFQKPGQLDQPAQCLTAVVCRSHRGLDGRVVDKAQSRVSIFLLQAATAAVGQGFSTTP